MAAPEGQGRSVGILGGTFNPVHAGHLRMAVEVREALGLTRVDLVPAAQPYHKMTPDLLPYEVRLQMVEWAVEGISGLCAGDAERGRTAPSYTWDLMEQYREMEPEAAIWFLTGGQTLVRMADWKRGPELLRSVSVAAVDHGGVTEAEVGGFIKTHLPGAERSGTEPVWRTGPDTRIAWLATPRLEISSTLVRDRWRAGRSLALLVPPRVEQYLNTTPESLEMIWGKRSKGPSCP